MFEKLDNRCFFRGELVFENEMHIGSGKGDGRTDALVVKDFKNEPFIPGSSVRGVLRSVIEKLVASLGKKPCLLMYDTCITTSKDIQNEFKIILEHKDSSKIKDFLNDNAKICPVCRIFGSPVFASKIKITDMQIKKEKESATRYSVRHGVAINRDTETSQDKAKFDYEVVPKESRFNFELIGENLKTNDLALLALGIQEMIDGNFWLGGKTSRGLGKCKLEKLNIEYFIGAEGLKNYLKGKCLFSWDNIPGNDNVKLINFLKQKFGIDWIKTEAIKKTDDGKTITVDIDHKSLSIELNNEKAIVNLKTNDGITDEFIVKTENGELNIYKEKYLTPMKTDNFLNLANMLLEEEKNV